MIQKVYEDTGIKTFTKSQRLSIYKKMLALLRDKRRIEKIGFLGRIGFCCLIDYSTIGYEDSHHTSIEYFPELMEIKPPRNYNGTAYWFNPHDRAIREYYLQQIIAKMSSKT